LRWILPTAPHIPQLSPIVFWEGQCPYLEDKETLTAGASVHFVSPSDYQDLMDKGMRRSGHVIYRPICVGCRQCQPLRIQVARFVPSKSQKRLLRKYQSRFKVTLGPPQVSEERISLYNRYQQQWHASDENLLDLASYDEAFVQSPVQTQEVCWRDTDGRLVGIGIVDVLSQSISSVYYYWDPAYRDYHLGTLSILQEIEMTREMGKSMYYMGFMIKSCGKMAYKTQFEGAEVWCGEDWRPLPGRNIQTPEVLDLLHEAEKGAVKTDDSHFPIHRAVRIFSQRG
jgi:leucyl-tRNA---protein transferase